MEKKKVSLTELNVKSFKTTEKNDVKGGSSIFTFSFSPAECNITV